MRSQIFIIAIAFTYISPTFGNSSGIDSLWKNYPSISDSGKLELLGETCFNLVWVDTAKSLIICKEMLRLIPGCNNTYAKINSYRTAGLIYQELEKFNEALENYNQAIKLSQKHSEKDIRILYGKTLSNLGLFYHKNGDYQTALKNYLQADSLLEPFDLYNYKINNLAKISDVYDHLNQDERREYYYKKIFKLAENAKDTVSMAQADNSYALYAMGQHNYDLAKAKLLHCLELSANLKDPVYIITCYSNLGELEIRQLNYTKAIPYLQKAENIARECGDNYKICRSLIRKAGIYNALGKFKDAIILINEGIAIAREQEYNDYLKQLLEIAIEIEDTLGNYKKALNYNKEYVQLLKNNTDLEVRKTINFLDAKYQAEKREAQIRSLETKQKLQLLEISRNKLWITILTIILLLLAITAGLMGINYNYKRKIAQQEIDLNQQKIKELEIEKKIIAANAIIQGEEVERSRLARDLHDGLGGLLSGLKLKLSDIKGNYFMEDEKSNDFNKAIDILDSSVTELRRVAHNMMPETLLNFGLKAALQDFCNQIDTTKQLKIKFQFYGDEVRINNSLENTVYKIAMELINNSLKHADADEIFVQLIQNGSRVALTVQDNGKGFDSVAIENKKSFGLKNIRARVESFGGTIDLNSAPGKGTEILIEFSV